MQGYLTPLDRRRFRYDEDGTPAGSNCTYYAYCLMGNHFHLLIRERDERVGETIKRIASSYVYYYNRKYGRDGHLFKERFKSEPVRSALPLATNGTQERHGLLHRTAEIYTPKSSQGGYSRKSKGLRVQFLGRV